MMSIAAPVRHHAADRQSCRSHAGFCPSRQVALNSRRSTSSDREHMYMKSAFALTLLACIVPAHADGTAAALYKTGSLTVDVSGPDVGMQLRLPMTRGDTSGESKQ